MYIKQKELLAGLDKKFVKQLIDVTEKKTYKNGEFVFHEGHPASRFYVLQKGRVSLTIGATGQMVFLVDHAGEAFGWSSLLGRNVYAATAQCTEPTVLLGIQGVKFNLIVDQDPVNGLILIRRLGVILGHRLHGAYQIIASMSEVCTSYGTGQVMETTPPV
jgi:CRP-like cAMP-binding protein